MRQQSDRKHAKGSNNEPKFKVKVPHFDFQQAEMEDKAMEEHFQYEANQSKSNRQHKATLLTSLERKIQ